MDFNSIKGGLIIFKLTKVLTKISNKLLTKISNKNISIMQIMVLILKDNN